MTQISRYVIDDKVTGSDKWIGSDAQTQYTTKNFTPTKLAVYFNENQVIDIGTPIRYKYDILEVGDTRLPGTITFNPQVGTPYSLSSISSFILSKYTLKGNDVTQYLNFLIGSNVLIYKADDINIFGLYKVVSLVENIDEPDFFDVVVSYTTGNGSIVENKDYLVSLIDIPGGDIPTKTSDLINDGEDGVHPFITSEDVTPQVNSDWDATTGVAEILNKPTIPSVTGFVPYTGATDDTDLGLFDITAAHLIKDGGVSTQFLKADGSVDNNIYLTSADLPSTLELFATTSPAAGILGYNVLVRNVTDARYDTVAVNVPTGVITTQNMLVGSLITDNNIISGNPGLFDITTIGNIRRISGTGQAEFYFRIYKRDALGVETFITQSNVTLPVLNGGYAQFSATALWNDGIFLDTDRVVIKYYASRIVTSPVGSDPSFDFQFGGITPVRSTAAIPVAVLPNIYLRDLADVEDVAALNNEILYWNDTSSLWEHSSVINLLPPASSTVNGYLSSVNWSTFNGKFTLPTLTSGSVLFSNGTTIAQDNANFFWDDINNRLGIGTNTLVASAKVQINSTTQGFLPPRMTNAQRLAIATPAIGLMVYCTDTIEGLYINKSTGWTYIG